MVNIKQRLLSLSVLLLGLGLYVPVYQKIYRAYTQFAEGQIELPAETNNNSYTGRATSPDGIETYELTNRGILVTNKITGRQKEFKLPRKFPELSWGTDIAYDSKRDLVAVVSFGGEGFFYRFDVEQGRWLDFRSLDDVDLKSLTYDRVGDRYIAWGGGALGSGNWADDTNLVVISAMGKLLAYEDVASKIPDVQHLSDRIDRLEPEIRLSMNGDNVVLTAYPSKYLESIYGAEAIGTWHYNLDEGKMRRICKFGRYP